MELGGPLTLSLKELKRPLEGPSKGLGGPLKELEGPLKEKENSFVVVP